MTDSSTEQRSERRRDPRIPVSGQVEIVFENPERVVVPAELIERSTRGVRLTHACQELVSGLEIQIVESELSSRARVVWTHVLDGRRVTGCLLL